MSFRKLLPHAATIIVVVTLILTQQAWAAPLAGVLAAPAATSKTTIAYQGYLTDGSGNPVNASLDIVFKLYSAATGGTALWSETQPAVAVSDGLFSVLLGSVTPLPSSLIANNPDLWLGITVGSDTEMSPRDKLASAPYAMMAGEVPDASITQYKLADSAVTSAKIADNAVGPGDVGFNYAASTSKAGPATDLSCTSCVSNGAIADAAVNSAKIADGSVGAGDVGFNYAASTSKAGPATGLSCSNCVSNGAIADAAVNSAKIADDTIGEADIADSFVARNSDAVDGYHYNNLPYAATSHVHDDRYFTESESDSRFINASGDTMTGILRAPTFASPAGSSLTIDAGDGSFERLYLHDDVEVSGQMQVNGQLNLYGVDVWMSACCDRGDGGWALTHDYGDKLVLNGAKAFAGGVLINNLHTAGVVEDNLLTAEQTVATKLAEFSQGDVLCWNAKVGQIAKCTEAKSPLIVAVADENGKPLILGAEPVKVLGPVVPGDLLVSSSVPGYAVAWSQVGSGDPPTGTVVGKCLESLAAGRGVVKTLIQVR